MALPRQAGASSTSRGHSFSKYDVEAADIPNHRDLEHGVYERFGLKYAKIVRIANYRGANHGESTVVEKSKVLQKSGSYSL